MAKADEIYEQLVYDILMNGRLQSPESVRAKWGDGTPAPALSILSAKLKYDCTEVPMITTKKVYDRKSKIEMFWIWIIKSNNIDYLHENDVDIWDKWVFKEGPWKGTIGPAYGWQLRNKKRKYPVSKVHNHLLNRNEEYEYTKCGKFIMLDQVDYLMQELKNSPESRRHMTSLWGVEDLPEMYLEPCVWKTNWQYWDNKLNLIVGIRSNDIALGNVFNVLQYYLLLRMMCQVLGYEIGTLTFDIDNAHIYDRHLPNIIRQIGEPKQDAPTVWINPDIKNLYDFKPEDIEILDKPNAKKYDYEIAE